MKPFPQTRETLLETAFLDPEDWSRFSSFINRSSAEISEGESVLCAEQDRVKALAVLFATILRGGAVFMANPAWSQAEWEQLDALNGFHQIFGNPPLRPDAARARRFEEAHVMIPSGGTSGQLKFCNHSLNTLSAAVRNLFAFHGSVPLDSINCLPLYHVSGLMPVLRACLTGGCCQLMDWQILESGTFPAGPREGYRISLVPTQLARLLRSDAGSLFLHSLDVIYIGGSGVPVELIQTIRSEKLPVLFTYGMTETAAMIVVGTREDTDADGRVWGSPLPGVKVTLNEDQAICIRTDSLFRGYYPEDTLTAEYVSSDIGRWMPDGQLQVVGRRDFLINCGGEKVNPVEVEQVLKRFLPGVDLAVTSRRDPEWGERVIAVLETSVEDTVLDQLRVQLSAQLAPYKLPCEYVTLSIPRSALGKVNRLALQKLLNAD